MKLTGEAKKLLEERKKTAVKPVTSKPAGPLVSPVIEAIFAHLKKK